MAENSIKRIARWMLWSAGGLTAFVVGLHFLLPTLLNTHAVRSRFLQMAGEAIPGKLDAARLGAGLLPMPRLVLSDLVYTLPGKANLHLATVTVYPNVMPLIGGRFQLRSAVVQSPELSVELPHRGRGADPAMAGKTLLPLDGPAVKDSLAALPEDWRLYLTDGRLILNRNGKAVAQFHGIDLRVADKEEVLSIIMESRTGEGGRFGLDAELDRRTFDGKGEVELTGMQVDALAEIVKDGFSGQAPRGKVDLSLILQSDGLQRYQVSIACSSPALLIKRNGRHVRLGKIDLEGSIRLTHQRLDASLTQLHLAEPKADLSGKLVWNRGQKVASPPLHLSVQVGESDVTRLRSDLISLFPKLESWTLFEVIRGGTLVSMALESSGASWGQIGRLRQLTISGRATGSRIFVPGAELNLTQVDGEWQLNNGELIVQNATAHLDNTRGTDGFLKLCLADDPKTMNLDIQIDADLAELPLVLKRVISKPEALTEMDRIRSLEGTASGRLLLSGDMNRPDVNVSVSNVSMDADYQRLPKAVAIRGGPLNVWVKQGWFGLEGAFKLQEDVALSTKMTVNNNQLDVQQLVVSDPRSSADVAFRYDKAGRMLDLRFEGELASETIAKVWPGSSISGRAKGRFSVKVPVDRPLLSTYSGHLEAADLTLPVAALGGVVHIARADVDADKGDLNIKQLDLEYDGQCAEISGAVRSADERLVLDLKLNGEEIDLDRIVAAWRKAREEALSDGAQGRQGAGEVRGTIDTQVDRLVYDGRVWDALQATVTLEDDQTNIAMHKGNLCGISMRGLLRRTPQGIWIDSEQRAEKQTLKLAGGCLVKGQTTERLEGTYDIKGILATSGQTEKELVSHLRGVVDLNVVDGRVFNIGGVGMFTNILEYLSINNLIMGDHPSMRGRDFKYNSFQLQLHLRDGLIEVKTAEVLADAVNMVAEGTVDIATRQLDLTVLVSPLTTVDTVIRHLPVVGKILKGTLIAIPVGVKGPLNDPTVIPLSSKAVGTRLADILGGILKAPIQLVEPIFQSSEPEASGEKEASERSDTPGEEAMP